LEAVVTYQLLQEIHTLKHLSTFCIFNFYQLSHICHTAEIGHLHNNLYVLCEKKQMKMLHCLPLQMQD